MPEANQATKPASAQQRADQSDAAAQAAAAAAAAPERPTVTGETKAHAAAADRSSAMVFVGCKLPGGVILDLDRFVPINDRGDVRIEKGKLPPITLRGWAHRVGIEAPLISPGGYVLTPVPAEFWREWFDRNKDGDLIASQMIICGDSEAQATAKAAERAELTRVFRGAIPSKADGVETATNDRGTPLLETARALI